MASFGEELRREREVRGITLAEIADATKINCRFLEALEEDNFTLLPPGIYAAGFVKAYARYLGMDEEETYNHFVYEASGAQASTPRDTATLAAMAARRDAGLQTSTGWSPALRAAVALVAAGLLGLLVWWLASGP